MRGRIGWREFSRLIVAMTALAAAAGIGVRLDPLGTEAAASTSPAHEVWVLDQSGSGGTLHIFDGASLQAEPSEAPREIVDLEGEARSMCEEQTGSTPVRAHMALFNSTYTHAIVSYVISGHVLFMDAATRTPIRCFDVGAQAHATFPSPDDTYATVANQNGKTLHRIDTDANGNGIPYEGTDDIVLDEDATLDLAACTTPNGFDCQDPVLRPDNAIVCPVPLSDGRLVVLTLRGGGMFVADATTTPMSIVAEYDKFTVRGNGCGGLQRHGRVYINSNGGTPAQPTGAHLYSFPVAGFPDSGFNAPNVPAPKLIFSFDGDNDGHGADFMPPMQDRYLWVADRFANRVEVVDSTTDTHIGHFTLVGRHSPDPAPDGMFAAPGGAYAYVSMRGPCPLTANVPSVDNAVGATPGVGVIAIQRGGTDGMLSGVAPISQTVAPFTCASRGGSPTLTERADPHGIVVRRL